MLHFKSDLLPAYHLTYQKIPYKFFLLFTFRWLGKVSRGEELTDVGLFALLFSARVYFGDLVQAWKYSQYLQYISSALDRKTKPAHGTYPGSKHCFDIAFSSAVNK